MGVTSPLSSICLPKVNLQLIKSAFKYAFYPIKSLATRDAIEI